jgi:hypothetical protein
MYALSAEVKRAGAHIHVAAIEKADLTVPMSLFATWNSNELRGFFVVKTVTKSMKAV